MAKIRVKFARKEDVKYISHLDMMRVFERALRRADIPIAYSEGFNPHPKMTFALPLPVGVTSDAEYADFEVDKEIAPEEFKKTLNSSLPDGIEITGAALESRKESLMSTISSASFKIQMICSKEYNAEEIETVIKRFLAETSILVEKETKNGIKKADIRPLIYSLYSDGKDSVKTNEEYVYSGYMWNLYAVLGAGSNDNLKPELLISALSEYIGKDFLYGRIHRTGLYTDREGKISPMIDHTTLCAGE